MIDVDAHSHRKALCVRLFMWRKLMRNRGILSFLAWWVLALGTVSLLAQEETEKELLPVWDLEKVSILVNQDQKPVSFAIEQTRDGDRIDYTLRPGEVLAVSNPQQAAAVFEHGKDLVRLRLLQDEIYLFIRPEGILELVGIGPYYGENVPKSRIQGRERQRREDEVKTLDPITIPVRIYTDTNIPLAEVLWRKRVNQRIEDASRILERTCFVKLEIRSFEPWTSDPQCENLQEVLKDFEAKVPEEHGGLSIGFTAHRNAPGCGTELGVARQPFCGKILLREEAPQITEVERLETLLHELGHFLGAVHTSDENSVMRTVLHERHARDVNFVIGFDPLNALAMNLWVRQYRRAEEKRPRGIHPDIAMELLTVYQMVQQFAASQKEQGIKVLENPNVDSFVDLLTKMLQAQGILLTAEEKAAPKATPETKPAPAPEVKPEIKPEVKPETKPEVKPVQKPETPSVPKPEVSGEAAPKDPPQTDVQILEKMMQDLKTKPWETEKMADFELPVQTARYVMTRTLLALAKKEPLGIKTEGKSASDVLGERIVRYAALAAREVGGTKPWDSVEGRAARAAFVLACEIFLEPSGAIGKLPVYGRRFRAIETPELKKLRSKLVGSNVSIFGRSDHSQHFWLSAALAIQLVPDLVENIGVEKELNDDQEGGTGFDMTDLNADLAGTWFSTRVLKGEISLDRIGKMFEYTQVVPAQIRIPKRLKHPKTAEEISELLMKLRTAVDALQEKFED